LTDLKWLAGHAPRNFFQVVTEGRGAMPAWQGRLTPEQRWAAIEYMRGFAYEPSATPLVSPTAAPASKPSADSIARGGRLYDQWWKEVKGAVAPKDNQSLWASQTTNTATGSATWRCKECHGWDYKGKDGAYGSGSHKTGFPGVWDAAQKKNADELAAILKGSANPQHDFSKALGASDLTDLANFLKAGLVDASKSALLALLCAPKPNSLNLA
jgi:hypothetical protein